MCLIFNILILFPCSRNCSNYFWLNKIFFIFLLAYFKFYFFFQFDLFPWKPFRHNLYNKNNFLKIKAFIWKLIGKMLRGVETRSMYREC